MLIIQHIHISFTLAYHTTMHNNNYSSAIFAYIINRLSAAQRCLLLALPILLAASCSDNPRGAEAMAQAQQVIKENPDSALAILSGVSSEADGFHNSQRMAYYLLLANAKNKAYADMSADSIMHEVADYYDTWGDSNERMQSLYLLGCVYRDRGDSPTALRYYNDAVHCADTTSKDCDYAILASLYGQMTDLYRNNDLAVYTKEIALKAVDASLKNKDTLNALVCAGDVAYAYNQMEQKDSALIIVRKTIQGYQKHKLLAHASYAILSSMHMNMMLGNKEALSDDVAYFDSIYQYGDSVPDKYDQYYCYKAMSYMHRHDIDSAEIYYNKALKYAPSNINCAVMAYKGLRDIHRQLGNHTLADKYSDMYCMANDSSFIAESKASVRRMHSLYNYNRAEKEKNQAERKATILKYTIMLIILAIIIMAILAYSQYKKKKREQQNALYQINRELAKVRNKYIDAQNDLQAMQTDREAFMSAKQKEIEELKLEMARISTVSADENMSYMECCKIKSEAVDRIYRMIERESIPHNRDIQDVAESVQKLCPTLWDTITRYENHLSLQEINVCVLLRAGFTTSETAFILYTSIQRITNIKAKINKTLFNAKGAKGLEERLAKLS